eukprot:NODE_3260_length_686_cov_165.307692_g2320_i0.p1 GENE.NODE_3260_length_686_cov_165.307692_g2320_i0~~NODE_3260_length_686_cov_165.307692_g2320_i0.p1  ORF type:complete len:213 (-),score=61.62 NODE_3260_length_686_cov_165.307692_g2320_i0:20-658(-)
MGRPVNSTAAAEATAAAATVRATTTVVAVAPAVASAASSSSSSSSRKRKASVADEAEDEDDADAADGPLARYKRLVSAALRQHTPGVTAAVSQVLAQAPTAQELQMQIMAEENEIELMANLFPTVGASKDDDEEGDIEDVATIPITVPDALADQLADQNTDDVSRVLIKATIAWFRFRVWPAVASAGCTNATIMSIDASRAFNLTTKRWEKA